MPGDGVGVGVGVGGIVAVAVAVGALVGVGVGPQSRNKIDTLGTLVTARSCLSSPLKSPTTTELALAPAPKLVGAPKLPAPSPNKIDTLFELLLATARSCLPSPLKSPTATE